MALCRGNSVIRNLTKLFEEIGEGRGEGVSHTDIRKVFDRIPHGMIGGRGDTGRMVFCGGLVYRRGQCYDIH